MGTIFGTRNSARSLGLAACLLVIGCMQVWGEPTVLFHETFGSNSGSARVWDDEYMDQSGVTAVYSYATSYTVTNAKQTKNNMGYGTTQDNANTDGSAILSTAGTQGTVIIGPLNVSSYSSLTLTHWFGKSSGASDTWNESRASNPDVMKVSYSTDNSTWSDPLTRTGSDPNNGTVSQTAVKHNYVQASYTLPAAAEVSTLYLKFEFYCYKLNNKSEQIGQVYIDEIDLTGTLSYDVTYNNGGHGTAPSNTKAIDLTLPSMSATGYTFNGWKADKAVTNKSTTAIIAANTLITSGTIVTLSQATTFTAQWTAKTTTVSFNQNSGTGGQTSSVSATYDQAMPTPITTPTRDHYDFGGYYDGAGGTGTQYYTNTGASAHTWNKDAATATLYAKWTEHALTNYHTRCLTVTYAAGEGSGVGPSNHTMVNPNSTITLAANTFTAPTGKAFDGWHDGTSKYAVGASYTVTASKTMTAQWAFIDYNVTYSAPSNGNYTIKVADGEASSATKTAHYGQTITLAATPTTGYHFSSWTIKKTSDNSDVTSSVSLSSSTNKDATFTMPDYGVTVTATFAINQHTITWKSEDGTSTLETDASQNYGTATAFNGATPTKATTASYTYTFDGWTTAANGGGTFYANGSTPTVSGDATYYAHFSAAENVASVTVGGATTYYTTLAGAMGDAMLSDNSTIKILDDISGQPALTYNVAKKCTLDLNNHTVAGRVDKLLTINNASANFTITDGSGAKGGALSTIVDANARVSCLYITAGTVNMKAGKIYGENTRAYGTASSKKNVAASGIYAASGTTFVMDGGTVESLAGYSSYAIYAAQSTTTSLTINDGLIKGHTDSITTAAGIFNYTKGLVVNGGHIIGHAYTSTSYGLYLNGGHATVNGGTIEATNDTTSNKGATTAYGIYVAYKSSTYKGVLTIPSSSTVNVLAKARTTTASAVTIGGGSTGNTIAGGTFTAWTKTGASAYGVYSSGNVTVSGGTFNVNSKTTTAYGIYATRGTTTVNSTPTFNVKAGSTTACGALASGTVGKAGTGKYSGTITINGGTFNVTSTTTTAYGVQAGLYPRTVSIEDKVEPNDTISGQHYMPGIINVTDGIFNVKATTNTAYGIYVDGKNTESGEAGTTVRIPKATITGGKFKITSAGDATLAYAMNTAADNTDLVVQGGYYSTKKTDSGNIEDKYTATGKSCNYHVFTPSGVAGYDYKVAEGYTLTWNLNGGTVTTAGTGAAVDATGTPNIVVERGASITAPTVTKTGYTFSSWSPSVPAAMPAANTTYAATWTANTITITWNPNGEGASVTPTSSSYTYDGSTVTLPTPTRPLSVFTGWYTEESGGAEITEVGTTNKPLEDVTYYAHWRVLSFEVKDQAGTGTADIHLTSTRGVTVYATSDCGNLITIKADNLDAISNLGGGTANKQNIQIKYLDANNGDAVVDKANSPFRLCNNGSSNYNNADGSNINLNGLTNYSQTYSISYTPSEYGKIDHYKLQLRLQNNNTEAITIQFDLYGRSLPDEFVIAAKYADDGKWYALPNTLGTTSSASAPTPTEITVDNATSPTRAMNVPSSLIYKACDRYKNSPNTQFASIRFSSDGSNHMQASTSATAYQLWLAPSGTNAVAQNWYLNSSDFSSYLVQLDPANSNSKKLGFYNSSGIKMGFHGTAPKGCDVYFLSTGEEYEAEVQAWTEHDMLVELESSITSNSVTATLNGTTVAGIATGSGTTYIVHTEGLNYADKSGKELVIRWKNSNTILGTTKIEMPNVIAVEAGNWPTSSAPTIEDYVVLKGATSVTVTDAKAKDVVLDKSGDNSGSLTINAGKELVVAQKVHVFNGSSFGATGEFDIEFGSTSAAGLGALAMGTHDGTNNATVNFSTLSNGSTESESAASASDAQYVGTPFGNRPAMLYQFYNSWMYKFINTGVPGWVRVNGEDGLEAFKGYCIFSADGTGHSYWMQGTLVASTDQTINLRHNGGDGSNANNENMLANSWMAPIQIAAFDASDFTNADATIYIYNTGSPDDYRDNNGATSTGTQAGQYSLYTVNTCPTTAIIPSMQAFSVYTSGSSPKITLDYSKLVYNPAEAGSVAPGPNKAPKRAGASEEEADKMRLFVRAENGYGDMLYMWEREDFEEGFENGWDGRKMFGEPVAPQLYAITPDGNMAINCVPDWEGTVVGFRAGTEDNLYTFSFEYEGNQTWYLNDLKEEESTRIMSGNTYQFSTADGDSEARFIISATPIRFVPTAIENGEAETSIVRKLLINDHVYIIRHGRMYDATGVMVK